MLFITLIKEIDKHEQPTTLYPTLYPNLYEDCKWNYGEKEMSTERI